MDDSAIHEWDDSGVAEAVAASAAVDTRTDNPEADLVRSDLVERVFSTLAADAERGEGHLQRTDINRIYLRKRLSIAECIEVESRLNAAGYALIDDDEDPVDDEQASGSPGSGRKPKYLSAAEERELGRRIQLAANLSNDASHLDSAYVSRVRQDAGAAREMFVVTNLRWVEKLAWRRGERRYITLEDLKQEGLIGLLRAVELYDPERGFRFKTYATWWIEQRMDRAIADENRIVRLPVHLQEKLVKVRRAKAKLTLTNGRHPTEDELAEALGLDPERLMKLLWRVHATEVAEGDSLIGEDTTLMSVVADDAATPFEVVSQRELEECFANLLGELSPREERILRMRFGIGMDRDYTLESIGQEYGVTRERIRQIEAKALGKLKHPSRSRRLRGFLDA